MCSLFSDSRTDVNVQQKIAEDEDGWLDLELVKGLTIKHAHPGK